MTLEIVHIPGLRGLCRAVVRVTPPGGPVPEYYVVKWKGFKEDRPRLEWSKSLRGLTSPTREWPFFKGLSNRGDCYVLEMRWNADSITGPCMERKGEYSIRQDRLDAFFENAEQITS